MSNIIEKLGITKAPWKGLHGDGVDKRGNKKVYSGNLPICTVRVTDNDTENCSLISAAPELLEALILVQEFFPNVSSFPNSIQTKHGTAVKKCIDAIQKATNKSWEEIKELIK